MTRLRCRVLRAFEYADDHVRATLLPTGEYIDIDVTCVPGLAAGGYVEEVGSAPLTAEDHEQVEKLGLTEPEPEPKHRRKRKA